MSSDLSTQTAIRWLRGWVTSQHLAQLGLSRPGRSITRAIFGREAELGSVAPAHPEDPVIRLARTVLSPGGQAPPTNIQQAPEPLASNHARTSNLTGVSEPGSRASRQRR